jgi:glycerol-3-phosphate O-acyltransferase/dihydroxyacetone phosphate acyltransferase
MLWYILQFLLVPLFPVFFKRIQGKNVRRARVKAPVFIAMNHPNSFMDSMAFTWLLKYPKTYYMARGDAFKKGLIDKTLQSIGLVPIYRFKDVGYESAKKNVDSFKMVYRLLDKRKKVMVFAEGLSMQERRLIPLKKGTAKMALGYIEQGGRDDIQILPVGVTYSTPSKFRGDAYYQVGEPIFVKDYYEEYKQQPVQTVLKLTKVIEDSLKRLTLDLSDKENDLLIEQLQPILKKQFIEEHKLKYNKLEDQQKYWEFIVTRLNNLTTKFPEQIIAYRKQVDTYDKQLQQLKLRDHLIYNSMPPQYNLLTVFNFSILIIGFPFYVVGLALNFIAYYSGKKIADATCKDIEFNAAVNFGAGSLIWLLSFLAELIIIWFIFKSACILLAYIAIKAICGRLGLYYSPFKKKILGALRLRKIQTTNLALYESLQQQREQIVNFIMK